MDALDAALARRGVDRRTATVVTRTLVAADDAGFTTPTKPIGRYLPAAEAALLDRARRDLGGPRREGLAPRRRLARAAARSSTPPPCARWSTRGSSSSPTAAAGSRSSASADGTLHGVEAVIDKDLGAALLARTVEADVLVIGTDVPHAVLRFGTPEAERARHGHRRARCVPTPRTATSPAARWARRSTLPAGSSSRAARAPSSPISHHITDAVTGDAGTVVVPN